MGVHDALVDRVRHVDGGVDHEAGAVHRMVRFAHHVPVDVDPHEARGGDLLVVESVRIDEERRGLARDAHRQVPVDELGPSEVFDDPVRGGELNPELAFDGLRSRWGGVERRRGRRSWGTSCCLDATVVTPWS